MNFIKPSVEIIDETDLCKRIEIAARTCYKSEGRITDDSAEKMVKNLIKRGHESPLEHSSISIGCLDFNIAKELGLIFGHFEVATNLPHFIKFILDPALNPIVTGNVRAWRSICRSDKNNPLLSSVFYRNFPELFEDVFDDPVIDETYANKVAILHNCGFNDGDTIVTARFICDRGVSHELVRHRLLAISQESTRYVRYEDGLTFIEPWWWPEQKNADTQFVRASCQAAEDAYCSMVKMGCAPQKARCVLPNMLKTEVVATGTIEYWQKYVLPLRLSKAAHPDMRRLMTLFCEQMNWDPNDFVEEKR